MQNKVYYSIIILLAVFLSGCASVVTQKDLVGNKLRVEITFAGPVSAQARYYFVFSYNSEPLFPDVNLLPYLIGPGESYDPQAIIVGDSRREISYYYQNYFSSWGDYVLLEGNSFYLTKGAFPAVASDNVHYGFQRSVLERDQSADVNKIVLYFDLTNLNRGTAFANCYFNLLAVDANRKLSDRLDIAGQFRNIAGEYRAGTDQGDQTIASSLDIIAWQVRVE
ncbi:MAG: hypothetical protein WC838_05775 [Candidatus Margulisiibacteriota bacterium]|jgi:hypothetical protein